MSGLVQVRSDRGKEFQILGAATLKLREPNDVRTNGAELLFCSVVDTRCKSRNSLNAHVIFVTSTARSLQQRI